MAPWTASADCSLRLSFETDEGKRVAVSTPTPRQAFLHKTGVLLEMIKVQHTIFALPFALASMLIAARDLPSIRLILWILACCVFARTAAMSFNRWADADIDSRNPRTINRAIPAGLLERKFVLMFAIASSLLFVAGAAAINWLAFALSPVALVVLLGYSYAKRFTSLSHFILGFALGIAPIGAWVAVRAEIGIPSLLLGLGVLAWTAGFDIIYSCQDAKVDQKEGLFSIPSRYGTAKALLLSRLLHMVAILSFVGAGFYASLGAAYYIGVGGAALLLVAEQWVVNPSDPSRIEMAFFTINSWVGVVFFLFTAADILVFAK